VVADLRQEQVQLVESCSVILADLLEDLCCYQYRQKALDKSQAQSLEAIVNKAYRHWMQKREEKAFEQMKSVYAFVHSELEIETMEYPPELFDLEHWYAWGLNKKQLVTFAAASGATAGAAIDLAVAGHSFMLGALGGGLLGIGGALFGGDKLTKLRIKGLPLGGYEAFQGPITDRNFPFVVLGRFVYLFAQLKNRNHARRGQITVKNTVKNTDLSSQLENLSTSQKKKLVSAMDRLSKQKPATSMADVLLPLLLSI
jgi:hypothetical protein